MSIYYKLLTILQSRLKDFAMRIDNLCNNKVNNLNHGINNRIT